jgi:hypothetical protein
MGSGNRVDSFYGYCAKGICYKQALYNPVDANPFSVLENPKLQRQQCKAASKHSERTWSMYNEPVADLIPYMQESL